MLLLRVAAVSGTALLSIGCATPANHVLSPYTLVNGAVLQDVVTIAGDPQGGAPSVTVVSTYDVTQADEVELVSREHGVGPPLGPAIARGLSLGVPIAIGAIGAAAARNQDETFIQETNYSTQGNISYGGDAGDIDAANQAIWECAAGGDCGVSN